MTAIAKMHHNTRDDMGLRLAKRNILAAISERARLFVDCSSPARKFLTEQPVTFLWGGFVVTVTVAPDGPDTTRLSLDIRLGLLPYSAENRLMRQALLKQTLDQCLGITPPDGAGFTLNDSGTVHCRADTICPNFSEDSDILTALTVTLLSLRPALRAVACHLVRCRDLAIRQ